MTAKDTSIIKRNADRHPVNVAVQFRCGDETLDGLALNMSLGGMFIETSHPLKEGTRAFFNLRPLPNQMQFNLEAEVVWAKPPRRGRGRRIHGMGVRFLSSRSQSEATLNGILSVLDTPH